MRCSRSRRFSAWSAWLSSFIAHAALGLSLYGVPAPARPRPPAERFEVRLLVVPSPAPPPRIEPPRPIEPPPRIELPRPIEKPPAPRQAAAPVSASAPEAAPPAQAAPEPAPPAAPEGDAPPFAVLAASGVPFGSHSVTAGSPRETRAGDFAGPSAAVPTRAPALAKLSDLSRKPRAPSLDASLRQNYPLELRRRGVEGQAEVRVIVSPLGRVEHVSVASESAPGFGQACKTTLLASRWTEPLDRNGNPIGTRLTYRCRFQMER
jgi:periplasmic protein TonB